MRPSVYIFIMSRNVNPIDFTRDGVLLQTQGSTVSRFGAVWTNVLNTFRMNTLLINYRTASYEAACFTWAGLIL